MKKLDLMQVAFSLAILFAIGFVVCYFWVYKSTDPDLVNMHLGMLKISFFGYSGMNFASFILGLIQSFIWGILVGVVFVPIYNALGKK